MREFERSRACAFEDLPPHRPAGLEGRLLALVQAGYIDSGVTESVKIRRAEAVAKKIDPMDSREAAAGRALSRRRWSGKATRYAVIDRLVSHPRAERLFDRYRPALLVASSPGLIFSEVPLLRTARRRGVRIDGGRSELGQLHEQADAGPPRQPAHRLERPDEAAGGRAARLRAGRGPDRRHAAVGSRISAPARSSPRDAFFRADRRRSVAQADHR